MSHCSEKLISSIVSTAQQKKCHFQERERVSTTNKWKKIPETYLSTSSIDWSTDFVRHELVCMCVHAYGCVSVRRKAPSSLPLFRYQVHFLSHWLVCMLHWRHFLLASSTLRFFPTTKYRQKAGTFYRKARKWSVEWKRAYFLVIVKGLEIMFQSTRCWIRVVLCRDESLQPKESRRFKVKRIRKSLLP